MNYDFIVSIIGTIATTAAAIAAWLAAKQAKKSTDLTQEINNKNDQQKRNEVKPLLDIVDHGSNKDDGYNITFKNSGFQTVLFLEANITSDTLKQVEMLEDTQKCEIELSRDGLILITLNNQGHIGTLQTNSQLFLKYKTIYNDIITDTYYLKRGIDGKPKRTDIKFGLLE